MFPAEVFDHLLSLGCSLVGQLDQLGDEHIQAMPFSPEMKNQIAIRINELRQLMHQPPPSFASFPTPPMPYSPEAAMSSSDLSHHTDVTSASLNFHLLPHHPQQEPIIHDISPIDNHLERVESLLASPVGDRLIHGRTDFNKSLTAYEQAVNAAAKVLARGNPGLIQWQGEKLKLGNLYSAARDSVTSVYRPKVDSKVRKEGESLHPLVLLPHVPCAHSQE